MFRLSFLLFLTLAFLTGCKKPTEPPPPNNGPDTTSHDFIWTIDTLGDGNASILKDVCIIDENDVWAVGEIYLKDTSGAIEYPAYGAAHWDGVRWTLKRLPAQAPSYVTNLVPTGVFAFGSNEIWLASGGVHRFNGTSVTDSYWINPFPGNPSPILSEGQRALRLWGKSSNDLYAVGSAGGIAHFDGTSWMKLESGTTVDLTDVWGSPDGSVVWACGYSSSYSESALLTLKNGTSSTIWSMTNPGSPQPYAGLIQSMWGPVDDSILIVGGEGLYLHRMDGTGEGHKLPLSLGAFPGRVRGTSSSDVFIVGYGGMIWHFNGATWHKYESVSSPTLALYSVVSRGDLVLAVGAEHSGISSRAIITVGRRR